MAQITFFSRRYFNILLISFIYSFSFSHLTLYYVESCSFNISHCSVLFNYCAHSPTIVTHSIDMWFDFIPLYFSHILYSHWITNNSIRSFFIYKFMNIHTNQKKIVRIKWLLDLIELFSHARLSDSKFFVKLTSVTFCLFSKFPQIFTSSNSKLFSQKQMYNWQKIIYIHFRSCTISQLYIYRWKFMKLKEKKTNMIELTSTKTITIACSNTMDIMIGWWIWVHKHSLCDRWIQCCWNLTTHTTFTSTTWPMTVNFLYGCTVNKWKCYNLMFANSETDQLLKSICKF